MLCFGGGSADLVFLAVDECHRRRDQRLHCSGREDERPIRGYTEPVTRHDEQDAAHGGEDWRWLEGLGRLLRVLGGSVLVCEVFLRAGCCSVKVRLMGFGVVFWCIVGLKKGVQLMRNANIRGKLTLQASVY